jgi:PAS domain S-box-containing protein
MNKENENLSSCSDYRVIFEYSPNMVIYKDINGRVIDANKAYVDFLGIPKKELVGMSTLSLLKDKNIAKQTLADDLEVIKSGKSKLKIVRKFISPFSKNEIWGIFSKIPRYDDNGKIVGTISFVVDITERKKLEEKILWDQEYFKALLANIPLLVSEIDINGKFLYWNKYAEKVLGYTYEEAMDGLRYPDLQESKEKFEEIRNILAKNSRYDGNVKLKRKDGVLVSVHLVLIPSPNYVRGKGGFYGYLEDISERLAEEEKLKKLNSLMIGREVKMVELKKEIERLRQKK